MARKGKAPARKRRRVEVRIDKNGVPRRAPPPWTTSLELAAQYLDAETGGGQVALVDDCLEAFRLRDALTQPQSADLGGVQVLFAQHPIESSLSELQDLSSRLRAVEAWSPLGLRRASAALTAARTPSALAPPDWEQEIETDFEEIRWRIEFLMMRIERHQVAVHRLNETPGVRAETRSRDRMPVLQQANAHARSGGWRLTSEHLVALEILLHLRPPIREDKEFRNRLKQWAQLLPRQEVALETGVNHPTRVAAAEKALSDRGMLSIIDALFQSLLPLAKVLQWRRGEFLDDFVRLGFADASAKWLDGPELVPLTPRGF